MKQLSEEVRSLRKKVRSARKAGPKVAREILRQLANATGGRRAWA